MGVKAIAFKVWGEFAHFRRFYTTSSPLTFSFPPPPTVRGMVGALLGYHKDEYIEKTNPLSVGVAINSPIRKLRLGINLIYTKGSRGFDPTLFKETPRTQVPFEFLRDASYTIFVSGDERVLEELYTLLKEHRTHYTLSLGLSECLADFALEGFYTLEKCERAGEVSTVVPVENLLSIDFSAPQKLMKEKVPTALNQKREPLEFKEVLFNPDGGSLKGEFRDVWRVRETEKFVYLFTFPSQ